MMNILVFSKDRACQLEACLSSLKLNYKEYDSAKISVIYKATTEKFQKAYDVLENMFFPEVSFTRELLFKQQVLENLNSDFSQKSLFHMFLVDDDVFISAFSHNDKQFTLLKSSPNNIIALSLRLYGNINHCYCANYKQRIPHFIKECAWKWSTAELDWGYPMSLDGNVYNSNVIRVLCNNIHFSSPNTLEDSLSKVRPLPETLLCYPDRSKLLNNPANIVQKSHKNRVENTFSVEQLNEIFLSGKTIDIKQIQDVNNSTVHYPFQYVFYANENVSKALKETFKDG